MFQQYARRTSYSSFQSLEGNLKVFSASVGEVLHRITEKKILGMKSEGKVYNVKMNVMDIRYKEWSL
jgi:hypothetical protein